MLQTEEIKPEIIRDHAASWLRRTVPAEKKLEVFTLLSQALPIVKPGSGLQRDLIEKMIEITPDVGRINPVAAIQTVSESFLWISTDYITNFAQKILMLEKSAIAINPNTTLAALEKILIVCHCALIPLKIHGIGKDNEPCTEWQRQTFSSIINTIETNPDVDPAVSANILKISEIITYMDDQFADLNQKIHIISHEHGFISSSWH